MPKYIKGKFTFLAPSRRKYKKYDVYDSRNKQYITSFGAIRPNGTPYEQYFDKIGYYSYGDHHDKKRLSNYYSRHGNEATLLSPKWFSNRYLW
jgi:hypothetical protein